MTKDDEDTDVSVDNELHGDSYEQDGLLTSSNDQTPALTRDSSTADLDPTRPSAQRHSSLSHSRTNGTPRTTQRVRFELDDRPNGNGQVREEWIDDEDYLNSPRQDVPLLTDITPPAESPFLSDSFQPEEYLPDARPKSGMRSAFMNMANSIIGAGIIGQPYAFRQAGLTMGTILLVVLTVTVDWTIRLIVINSKLSGADSFQATMQHCFGKSGLIAISVAQWAFAFGGMIAFCIIVGDTIPHVIEALFPALVNVPFLWLLTDRRAVIVLFILGISWPLSLYRDIAKVCPPSNLQWSSYLLLSTASQSIYFSIDQHVHHYRNSCHARCSRRSRSSGQCQGTSIRQ